MKARALIGAVVLLAACASSSSGLRFPPGTPSWIRQNTIRAAKGLGDPHPASVSVTRGRYTIVVLTGKFTCFACSPSNSYPPPRGTVAVYRLDTQTHDAVDFGLCRDRASCVSNLCDGGCTVAKYGLDAAFSALYSHTQARGEVDFDGSPGGDGRLVRIHLRDQRPSRRRDGGSSGGRGRDIEKIAACRFGRSGCGGHGRVLSCRSIRPRCEPGGSGRSPSGGRRTGRSRP